jgi:hypothetical protein
MIDPASYLKDGAIQGSADTKLAHTGTSAFS